VTVEPAPPPAPPLRGQALRRRPAEAEAPVAPSEPRRPGAIRSWLTVETGLYLLFFVTAIISRFWELGVKGLHHDESLHAVYSFHYYVGAGYVHSPMMHGPLQFHYIDFFYTLFGATNDTARYASAVCGIFVVMSPFLLRRQLGRWPALIATFLFLISPSIMYFSRMAREDAITAFTEALLVVGLWRFISERRAWDFFLACAGFALMFTIKETSYIIAAVFGVFLLGLFAWQMGRWLFATLIAYGAAAGAAALLIMKTSKTAFPSIANQDPTAADIKNFIGLEGGNGLLQHPLIQIEALLFVCFIAVWGYLLWDQSRKVRRAALVDAETAAEAAPVPRRRRRAAALAEGVQTQVLTEPVATVQTDEGVTFLEPETDAAGNGHAATNGHENGAEREPVRAGATNGHENGAAYEEVPVAVPRPRDPGLLLRYEPGSLPYAVGTLLREPSTLWIGLGIMVGIYVAFYTSLFSNLPGLLTGIFGSVGYWIAQQEVRRGGQPWYYYLIIIPIYEPLVLLFSAIGTLFFGVKGVAAVVNRLRWGAEPDDRPPVPGAGAGWNVGRPINFASMSSFMPAFVIFWTVGVWGAYAYAGEKMPWLMIHIVQPSVLLAALFIGGAIAAIGAARRQRVAEAGGDEDEAVRTSGPRRAGRVVQAEPARWPWEDWSRPGSWVPALAFISLFVLICIAWAMNIDWQVGRNLAGSGVAESDRYKMWGFMMILFPGLLLVLVAGFIMWVGPRRVGRWTVVAVVALLSVYEVRSAVQLSYYNPDVPTEMAVYVQTSPDVVRASHTIEALSVQLTGKKDMGVMYDSLASWPWEWYFRDFKNSSFKGDAGPATLVTTDEAQINNNPHVTAADGKSTLVLTEQGMEDKKVLVLDASKWYDATDKKALLEAAGYEGTKYPMRWWFPEETYKDDANNPNQGLIPSRWDKVTTDANGQQVRGKDAIGQIMGLFDTIRYTLTTPIEMGRLWKYFMYREPYAPLGSTDMVVWVRNDVAPLYHGLQELKNLPDYDAMSR
jgi:predicted membrane-bound mannosyltransferase